MVDQGLGGARATAFNQAKHDLVRLTLERAKVSALDSWRVFKHGF
jgi:hypothetical protein